MHANKYLSDKFLHKIRYIHICFVQCPLIIYVNEVYLGHFTLLNYIVGLELDVIHLVHTN